MTQYQRIGLALSLAHLNQPHTFFWQESQQVDTAPYHKLLSKTLNFVRGELKSEANLLRFHDEFYQWREQLLPQDNLAYRLVELNNAALHSAVESLFDPECDDIDLLLGSLQERWDEYSALGAETDALLSYWQDIQHELNDILPSTCKLPFPKTYFALLKDTNVSLFGIEHD